MGHPLPMTQSEARRIQIPGEIIRRKLFIFPQGEEQLKIDYPLADRILHQAVTGGGDGCCKLGHHAGDGKRF